jgi:membrane-associated phospholipid phosphatase
VLHDYFPERKWTKITWGAAAVVPAWTGYQRYKAGKHFPTDVIAGYLVGGACGILIPELHKSPKNRTSLTITPSFNGVFLTYKL